MSKDGYIQGVTQGAFDLGYEYGIQGILHLKDFVFLTELDSSGEIDQIILDREKAPYDSIVITSIRAAEFLVNNCSKDQKVLAFIPIYTLSKKSRDFIKSNLEFLPDKFIFKKQGIFEYFFILLIVKNKFFFFLLSESYRGNLFLR